MSPSLLTKDHYRDFCWSKTGIVPPFLNSYCGYSCQQTWAGAVPCQLSQFSGDLESRPEYPLFSRGNSGLILRLCWKDPESRHSSASPLPADRAGDPKKGGGHGNAGSQEGAAAPVSESPTPGSRWGIAAEPAAAGELSQWSSRLCT